VAGLGGGRGAREAAVGYNRREMRFAVIVFPGTWSDGDCYYVLNDILGQPFDELRTGAS
jgi:hypothetical protein